MYVICIILYTKCFVKYSYIIRPHVWIWSTPMCNDPWLCLQNIVFSSFQHFKMLII